MAACRTLEEYKQVGDQAEAIAYVIKKMGGNRQLANQAMRVNVGSKVEMGGILGEPPGSGGAPSRSKLLACNLPSIERNRCRAARVKVVRN